MSKSEIALRKLPPHCDDAERAVLGAILLDNGSLLKVIGFLEQGDFYQTANEKVYKAMVELSEKEMKIDLITLSEWLLRNGDLEMIGGPPYLMEIMESTPTAQAIVYHAGIMKDKTRLRQLIAISTQLTIDAYQELVDPNDLLNRAEKLLYDLRTDRGDRGKIWQPLDKILPGVYEDITQIYEADDNVENSGFIPTGFTDVDERLVGLNKSDLIILAARPSMGKTSWALNCAVNVASRGIPVGVLSIETGNKKLGERMICSDAKVNSHAIHKRWLHKEDWSKLANSLGRLKDLPIYICDSPSLTLQDLRFKTRMIVQEYEIKLLFIDYLQLMHIKGFRGKRHEEVTEISRGIKSVARDDEIPIVALSQLNRKVEDRKPPRPILSDLKESGSIEENADVVLFLYRPGAYKKEGPEDLTIEVIIRKNRNGPIGTVNMIFEPKYTRFEDLGGI